MVDSVYMLNRKRYARPQAMLFADNPGFVQDGLLVPDGSEFDNFIVLSDDNRGAISMGYERLESRVRTVNGRMRSYHIADKLKIDVSWSLLPSRAFATEVTMSAQGFAETSPGVPVRNSGSPVYMDEAFTTDRGAGGVDLLDWYEKNTGSFWVYLSYDKHNNFTENSLGRLSQYNEAVEVFFANFDYSIEKRGGNNYDFWNISLSLEEV